MAELVDPPFSATASYATLSYLEPHQVPRWSATYLAAASVGLMWSMQMNVRIIGDRIGSTSTGTGIAELSLASAMLFVGKFAGSIVVLFGFPDAVQQPGRAAICFVGGGLAQASIAVTYFWGADDDAPWTTGLGPLMIAFFAAGLARCVTESVIFSYVSFFGSSTKPWIVAGFAVGFQLTGVIGYALYAWFGATVFIVRAVFLFMAACSIGAGVCVLWGLARKSEDGVPMSSLVPFETRADTWRHACQWRRWLPRIREHCVCIALATFVTSVVSGMVQLIYVDRAGFEVLPGYTMSENSFMACYSFVSFVTSIAASSMFTKVKRPLLLGGIAGVVALLLAASRVPLLATISGGASYFAYMLLSGAGSTDIDQRVDPEHNLITTTVWLAFTCFGCVAGSACSGSVAWILLNL